MKFWSLLGDWFNFLNWYFTVLESKLDLAEVSWGNSNKSLISRPLLVSLSVLWLKQWSKAKWFHMHACSKGIYNNLIESWQRAQKCEVCKIGKIWMTNSTSKSIKMRYLSASHFEAKNANLDSWIPLSTLFFLMIT